MHDAWLKGGILREKFTWIYAITWHKSISIYESYSGNGGEGEWNIEVLRNLNDWEIREYETLLLGLIRVRINGSRDQPVWRLNATGTFLVRSF